MCVPVPLMQAVSSAQKALGTALAGVVLLPEEQEQLSSRLQKAAAKKVADLLQVRDVPTSRLDVPWLKTWCSRPGMQLPGSPQTPVVEVSHARRHPSPAYMGLKLFGHGSRAV